MLAIQPVKSPMQSSPKLITPISLKLWTLSFDELAPRDAVDMTLKNFLERAHAKIFKKNVWGGHVIP